MREYIVCTLILLCGPTAAGQTAPADWKVVKDSKGLCQIRVPPEWALMDENRGCGCAARRFHSDCGGDRAARAGIPAAECDAAQGAQRSRGKNVREYGETHLLLGQGFEERGGCQSIYRQRAGGGGTCSCHGVVLPGISEEIAKTITLSLGLATVEQT